MRTSTLTLIFSALLAATALAAPSANDNRNHIDVPEHIDAIDRRDVKPTSTSSSSAAATTTAVAEKDDDPDFPDETGDRGSVDVPEDDGDDDDDDDSDDEEEEKKKEGAGRGQ